MTDCSTLDKTQLISQLISVLTQELTNTQRAAEEAHKGATHEQSKAETQYDTLGLEHAYLAEGQSRRIEELKHEILQLQHMALPDPAQEPSVVLGMLVSVENESQQRESTFFMAIAGGGIKLATAQGDVTVITPESPIGEELLGRSLDDEFKWPNGADGFIIDLA